MHVQTDLLYSVFCTLLQRWSWTALLINVKYLKLSAWYLKLELIIVSKWKWNLLISLHAVDLNNCFKALSRYKKRRQQYARSATPRVSEQTGPTGLNT